MEGYLLVHSRSKCNDGKYLSTFASVNICINDTLYPSVENAFQALKLDFLDEDSDMYCLEEFKSKFKTCSAKEAKTLGSKTSFKRFKLKLNTEKWNTKSVGLMYLLLSIRLSNDVKFKQVIEKYGNFYHYERSGPKSFWGGYFDSNTKEFVGNNQYGKLLYKLKQSI
jgi:predicted NAD-dependent protein-ADP-ribosyltransferase YbiA (DUF1768 family)